MNNEGRVLTPPSGIASESGPSATGELTAPAKDAADHDNIGDVDK
jgi:hypothetical protein